VDYEKIGNLIRSLRRQQGLTQLQLAQRLSVSDKAVSKWERGLGCPDLSLLPSLSNILGVDMEKLLKGELDARDKLGGNMKKLKFYVCPDCGNILSASAEAAVSCCGKKLSPLTPIKASEEERLRVEKIENEYYISSSHPMTKAHHVSFVAYVGSDELILKKLYPEWDLQCRLPLRKFGSLFWYCTEHGLFYQLLK